MPDKKKASEDFKKVHDRELTLRTLPMPADTIADDFISAGWLLSQMDMAGGRRAYDYIKDRAVTVGLEAMSFKKSVHVGDLLSFYTEIVRQGRTSMTVKVESWAQRRSKQTEIEKVTEGYFTFVAIDKNHSPIPITQPPPQQNIATLSKPQATTGTGKKGDLALKTIPMPRDANYLGDIFGGWILAQMDLACAKTAETYSGHRTAAVGIEAMTFHRPVMIGDDLSFYTEVVKTGNTSLTVRIETWAVRKQGGTTEKVTEGLFSYVAMDQDRKPVEVKPKL